MNFEDFEEFSSFFQDTFYIENSIVNFLISWQRENFLRKSRFLIEIFMETRWGFSYDLENSCS